MRFEQKVTLHKLYCHSFTAAYFRNDFCMKTILNKRIATYGILLILAPMILFHLLVLTGVIPFGIVWGGRLSNQQEIIRFEAISIFTLLLISLIVVVHADLFG